MSRGFFSSCRSLIKNKFVLVLLLLNLAAVLILVGVLVRRGREENLPLYYEKEVQAACEEFGLPKELVLAVIRTESDFRPDALSPAGARGLMQLTEPALSDVNRYLKTDYRFDDMYDPKINIRCGTCYLYLMYRQFGRYDTALAAYNAGPGVVAGWLANSQYSENGRLVQIPFRETDNYVCRVTDFWEGYIQLYKENSK